MASPIILKRRNRHLEMNLKPNDAKIGDMKNTFVKLKNLKSLSFLSSSKDSSILKDVTPIRKSESEYRPSEIYTKHKIYHTNGRVTHNAVKIDEAKFVVPKKSRHKNLQATLDYKKDDSYHQRFDQQYFVLPLQIGSFFSSKTIMGLKDSFNLSSFYKSVSVSEKSEGTEKTVDQCCNTSTSRLSKEIQTNTSQSDSITGSIDKKFRSRRIQTDCVKEAKKKERRSKRTNKTTVKSTNSDDVKTIVNSKDNSVLNVVPIPKFTTEDKKKTNNYNNCELELCYQHPLKNNISTETKEKVMEPKKSVEVNTSEDKPKVKVHRRKNKKFQSSSATLDKICSIASKKSVSNNKTEKLSIGSLLSRLSLIYKGDADKEQIEGGDLDKKVRKHRRRDKHGEEMVNNVEIVKGGDVDTTVKKKKRYTKTKKKEELTSRSKINNFSTDISISRRKPSNNFKEKIKSQEDVIIDKFSSTKTGIKRNSILKLKETTTTDQSSDNSDKKVTFGFAKVPLFQLNSVSSTKKSFPKKTDSLKAIKGGFIKKPSLIPVKKKQRVENYISCMGNTSSIIYTSADSIKNIFARSKLSVLTVDSDYGSLLQMIKFQQNDYSSRVSKDNFNITFNTNKPINTTKAINKIRNDIYFTSHIDSAIHCSANKENESKIPVLSKAVKCKQYESNVAFEDLRKNSKIPEIKAVKASIRTEETIKEEKIKEDKIKEEQIKEEKIKPISKLSKILSSKNKFKTVFEEKLKRNKYKNIVKKYKLENENVALQKCSSSLLLKQFIFNINVNDNKKPGTPIVINLKLDDFKKMSNKNGYLKNMFPCLATKSNSSAASCFMPKLERAESEEDKIKAPAVVTRRRKEQYLKYSDEIIAKEERRFKDLKAEKEVAISNYSSAVSLVNKLRKDDEEELMSLEDIRVLFQTDLQSDTDFSETDCVEVKDTNSNSKMEKRFKIKVQPSDVKSSNVFGKSVTNAFSIFIDPNTNVFNNGSTSYEIDKIESFISEVGDEVENIVRQSKEKYENPNKSNTATERKLLTPFQVVILYENYPFLEGVTFYLIIFNENNCAIIKFYVLFQDQCFIPKSSNKFDYFINLQTQDCPEEKYPQIKKRNDFICYPINTEKFSSVNQILKKIFVTEYNELLNINGNFTGETSGNTTSDNRNKESKLVLTDYKELFNLDEGIKCSITDYQLVLNIASETIEICNKPEVQSTPSLMQKASKNLIQKTSQNLLQKSSQNLLQKTSQNLLQKSSQNCYVPTSDLTVKKSNSTITLKSKLSDLINIRSFPKVRYQVYQFNKSAHSRLRLSRTAFGSSARIIASVEHGLRRLDSELDYQSMIRLNNLLMSKGKGGIATRFLKSHLRQHKEDENVLELMRIYTSGIKKAPQVKIDETAIVQPALKPVQSLQVLESDRLVLSEERSKSRSRVTITEGLKSELLANRPKEFPTFQQKESTLPDFDYMPKGRYNFIIKPDEILYLDFELDPSEELHPKVDFKRSKTRFKKSPTEEVLVKRKCCCVNKDICLDCVYKGDNNKDKGYSLLYKAKGGDDETEIGTSSEHVHYQKSPTEAIDSDVLSRKSLDSVTLSNSSINLTIGRKKSGKKELHLKFSNLKELIHWLREANKKELVLVDDTTTETEEDTSVTEHYYPKEYKDKRLKNLVAKTPLIGLKRFVPEVDEAPYNLKDSEYAHLNFTNFETIFNIEPGEETDYCTDSSVTLEPSSYEETTSNYSAQKRKFTRHNQQAREMRKLKSSIVSEVVRRVSKYFMPKVGRSATMSGSCRCSGGEDRHCMCSNNAKNSKGVNVNLAKKRFANYDNTDYMTYSCPGVEYFCYDSNSETEEEESSATEKLCEEIKKNVKTCGLIEDDCDYARVKRIYKMLLESAEEDYSNKSQRQRERQQGGGSTVNVTVSKKEKGFNKLVSSVSQTIRNNFGASKERSNKDHVSIDWNTNTIVKMYEGLSHIAEEFVCDHQNLSSITEVDNSEQERSQTRNSFVDFEEEEKSQSLTSLITEMVNSDELLKDSSPNSDDDEVALPSFKEASEPDVNLESKVSKDNNPSVHIDLVDLLNNNYYQQKQFLGFDSTAHLPGTSDSVQVLTLLETTMPEKSLDLFPAVSMYDLNSIYLQKKMQGVPNDYLMKLHLVDTSRMNSYTVKEGRAHKASNSRMQDKRRIGVKKSQSDTDDMPEITDFEEYKTQVCTHSVKFVQMSKELAARRLRRKAIKGPSDGRHMMVYKEKKSDSSGNSGNFTSGSKYVVKNDSGEVGAAAACVKNDPKELIVLFERGSKLGPKKPRFM